MWTCGNCGGVTDVAWYSSSWGTVCAPCRDRERRTVVVLSDDDADRDGRSARRVRPRAAA